jgi:D-alanyl-D-alanine carboxypeptidase/D-alanyl-D-alanine-endopeptidase (penicillin-binding protein 4)
MTIANPSPDLLMRDSLEVALKAAGIKVKHKNVKAEKKVATSLVLDYKSLELSKIVESLLIRSDNMYTECVLRAIASNAGKQPTSSNGVAVVKNFWKEKGLDVEGLFMLDGSGLSRTNKAPVSFFTQMLALALPSLKERNVDFELLFPVAGKNGTVRRVAANTPAAGKFALKSGSMSHVQCYVGYYPVDAPKYAVAILINSFTCPRSELVKMVGEMLVGIDAGLSAE